MVITGGVLSGLGKGIALASIGAILSQDYKVVPIKCDGYLNVDPGTMNPIEHGEVFVLDDGGEVDMDFFLLHHFFKVFIPPSRSPIEFQPLVRRPILRFRIEWECSRVSN